MEPRPQVIALSMLATLIMGIPTLEGNPTPEISLMNHFNDSELACYQQLKVLFKDGNCYPLLKIGPPCARKEWLVLNEEQVTLPNGLVKSYPVCKTKPCRTGQVFWSESNRCRPVGQDKEDMCPYRGVWVTNDWWGEGKCACERNNVRLESDVLNGKGTIAEVEGHCYPLYQQGPCMARHVLTPVLHDGQVVGRCTLNACDNLYHENPGSAYAQLTPPDGPCYRLGERGPCSADERFDVDHLTKEPGCITLKGGVITLDIINSALRCENANNNCKPLIPLKVVKDYVLHSKFKRPRKTRSKMVEMSRNASLVER